MATPISSLSSIHPSLCYCCVTFSQPHAHTCRSHCPISIDFCPHSHYFVVKFLWLKVIYCVMILSIWQFHYCCWLCVLTRSVTTWSQLTALMTGPCNSLLMDTLLCPAEVIMLQNARQAAALFSCVNFVISACLTIPDQYSIKEFIAFSRCSFHVFTPRNWRMNKCVRAAI